MFGIAILILIVAFGIWLIDGGPVKLARELGGRSLSSGAPPPDGEVGRLREEVEHLSREVRRLSDEQSFMVKLLAEGERRALDEGGEKD